MTPPLPGPWAITGHRDIERAHRANLRVELRRVVERIVAEFGCESILTGMAIGADQEVIRAIETLGESGTGVDAEQFVKARICPFDAIVPWSGQAAEWATPDRTSWFCALGRARSVRVLRAWSGDRDFEMLKEASNASIPEPASGTPSRNEVLESIFQRNDMLLAEASGLISVWDGRPKGGTAFVTQKALRSGTPTIVIDPTNAKQTEIFNLPTRQAA